MLILLSCLLPIRKANASNVIIFSEGFEGAFPGSSWSVYDANPTNGYDYWDDTSVKSHGGLWSGWCAGAGTQYVNTTVWTENFEGVWPTSYYHVVDGNPDSGLDFWGDSSYRSHGGSWSAWCAQNGTQYDALPDRVYNWEVHQYDNDMWTTMLRWADLTSYTFATFSFWYWINSEQGHDALYFLYHMSNQTGGVNTYINIASGNSGGWVYKEVTVPANAVWTAIGFQSDSTNKNYEGAYVDDLALTGSTEVSNTAKSQYDDNMMSYMVRSVDLSAYASATLSYWYWLSCERDYDYLQVTYHNSTGWFYTDTHTGNSYGWQYSETTIPSSADKVGLYFLSDPTVHTYEGVYVDDVALAGELLPPTYTATIWAWENVSGWLAEPIQMDGAPTGYSTPHNFTGLTGTHTFTVPSTDIYGNPFKNWTTGETSTTITVNTVNGTYTAQYYVTTPIPEFPNPVILLLAAAGMSLIALKLKRTTKPR